MLLWLTRKFPPQVGGMEKFNYELTAELRNRMALRLVAHGGSQRALPLYVGRAIRQIASLRLRREDVTGIHLGDALLAPIGLLCSSAFGSVPVSVSAHGLDVTYSPFPYQAMLRACLKRSDGVMCNSRPTMREVVRRGTPASRCQVITPGVTPGLSVVSTEAAARYAARATLARQYDLRPSEDPILVTVGRLVPRKGVAWFIRSVLPALWRRYPRLTYLVVGEGAERAAIAQSAREVGAGARVVLTGRVPDSDLTRVYGASDAFIMPNVVTRSDPEGFGIAALDASVAGLWVFASAADGIPDAVVEGQNGTLIAPSQGDRWVSNLLQALGDPITCRARGQAGRAFTLEQFSWPRAAERYLDEFRALGVA